MTDVQQSLNFLPPASVNAATTTTISSTAAMQRAALHVSVSGQFDDSPLDASVQEYGYAMAAAAASATTANVTNSKTTTTAGSVSGSASAEYALALLSLRSAQQNETLKKQQQQKQQQQPVQATSEAIPASQITHQDVMYGRGAKTNRHPGNQEFRRLVLLHQPHYFASRKPEKTEISRSIVRTIRERGGRFLRCVNGNGIGGWCDVGDAKAVEKTSQALREGGADRFRTVVSQAKQHHATTTTTTTVAAVVPRSPASVVSDAGLLSAAASTDTPAPAAAAVSPLKKRRVDMDGGETVVTSSDEDDNNSIGKRARVV